ncbi:DUF5047 domain-containing protein [Micromonospora sp. NPDC049645]|uniref:DUF5047 domain-containing protein n=1 Tax=Micromonospora sp. NPDC049645 TaxID=3155508 RepID=UPI0034129D39
MIEPGSSLQYRALYRGPHEPIVRVEVWDDEQHLATLPRILGGEVKAALTSQVTRRGSISVDRDWYPADEHGLLAPYGNRLRIYRGIRAGDGREFWFPVFTGLISDVSRKPRSPCVVEFEDRAAEVADAGFDTPEESRAGQRVVDEIARLIREGVPRAEFGQHDPIAVYTASQVWDDDRGQACDDLANAGGAFWYALADGRYVVRRVPWTWHPSPSPSGGVEPVATFGDRDSGAGMVPDGVIEDVTERMSRRTLYNSVRATADQPDGAEPLNEVVRDVDPSSPTYFGGKFGRRTLDVAVPSGSTAAVVRSAAATFLRRSRASAEPLTWEMMPDPSLELGDVLGLWTDRVLRAVVLSDFTLPLAGQGRMSCTGRPLVLPSGRIAHVE